MQAQAVASTNVNPLEHVTTKAPKTTLTKAVPNMALGLQRASFNDLERYVEEHLQYPELAKKHAVEGSVKILVVVSAEGNITKTQVINSLGFGCDEAALEVIKNMPGWVPASNYGIAAQDKRLLEFQFRLQ